MHVMVLGAGVIGVTTAYYLSEKGHTVTVVDRADDVASAASYANAGQLSYSFTDGLAKPGFLPQLPGLLAGKDPGSHIVMSTDLARWGLRFLRQCTARRARDNSLALLAMALRSATLIDELREKFSFDFAFRPAGKLVLLETERELQAAQSTTRMKNEHGCNVRLLTQDGAIAIEPALADFSRSFVGAVYSASDAVADACRFTRGLRSYLEQTGKVRFLFRHPVYEFVRTSRCVTGVAGVGNADAVVVCLGAWSGKLLGTVGINPHIYPVRGYSITLPIGSSAPDVSITSLRDRLVLSRLNGRLRIAGFADFQGFDSRRDPRRIALLASMARQLAPAAAAYADVDRQEWGGLRPMTTSGQPLTGATRINGLYVNAGHGMLGWTLACASAHDLAESLVAARRQPPGTPPKEQAA